MSLLAELSLCIGLDATVASTTISDEASAFDVATASSNFLIPVLY